MLVSTRRTFSHCEQDRARHVALLLRAVRSRPGGARTHYLRIKSALLYLLSYRPPGPLSALPTELPGRTPPKLHIALGLKQAAEAGQSRSASGAAATTSPTTSVAGGSSPAAAARSASVASVPVTVCWFGSVALAITAAGVSSGMPCAISRAVSWGSARNPIRNTSAGSRANASQSRSDAA